MAAGAGDVDLAMRKGRVPLVDISVSLFLPMRAVALYLAIAVYLTVPGRTVRRLLRRVR